MKLPLALWWGVLGFAALLCHALYRLAPLAWEPIDAGMSGAQWVVMAGWVAFNAYAEGYKGFQKQMSPRVVARGLYLADHPRPLHVALAPLFCMGYFHATKKRLIVAWVLTVAIIGLVAIVRLIDQPWRGIVDAGVVVGLGWGLAVMLVYFIRALGGAAMPVPPDVPEQV